MNGDVALTRRSVLAGAAGAAAAAGAAPPRRIPLRRTAQRRGIVYGSSTATWQLSDPQYRRLFAREAGILFTEDDRRTSSPTGSPSGSTRVRTGGSCPSWPTAA